MKRILLASLPVGGGHRALRDSLGLALASGPGAFEPRAFDSQDTKLGAVYAFCVHRAPWLQRLQFILSDTRLALPACVWANPRLQAEVRDVLVRERPDAVVATHFLVSAMFVRARRQLGLSLPVVNAIPDYGEPTEIFAPRGAWRPEGLIVMEPRVRERIVQRGAAPRAHVHLSGFLPRAPFQELGRELGAHARLPAARRLALWRTLAAEHPAARGLDPARPTVLFLGGSEWTEKTAPVLERLLGTPALRERLNVAVVCGRDERFRQALEARVAGPRRVALFGFVDAGTLARLMALADVPVLGSLAPASLHELMETRCGPLLLFHAIPGSEDAHPAYIAEQEVGLSETDPDAMLERVAQATGLLPAGPRLARLLSVYPERMRALREANRERATHLGAFLTHLMDWTDSGPLPLLCSHPEHEAPGRVAEAHVHDEGHEEVGQLDGQPHPVHEQAEERPVQGE